MIQPVLGRLLARLLSTLLHSNITFVRNTIDLYFVYNEHCFFTIVGNSFAI